MYRAGGESGDYDSNYSAELLHQPFVASGIRRQRWTRSPKILKIVNLDFHKILLPALTDISAS
jgi:hypothetical protein